MENGATTEVHKAEIKTGTAELKPISIQEARERMKNKAAKPAEKSETVVGKDGGLNNKTTETVIEPKLDAEGKPIVEPKIEPKVDAEGKPIVEPPAKKSIKDIAKPFSKTKAAAPIAEGEVVIPEPIKAKITDYEKQIAERDSILNDPDVKAFLEIKKAGKTSIDIFKEVLGSQVDTSKMTDAQIYEHGLKMNGVKPADELDNDSDDTSLEEEMSKFKDMGRIAQKREADAIRSEIEKANSGTTDTFFNKLVAHNEKATTQSQVDKQKQVQSFQKTQKELNDIADAYVGNEHYAVVGTPQLAESIKNFKLSDLIRTNEDGSLNAEDVFDIVHYKLTKELRLENLENQFFANGFNELKKEVEVTKGASAGIVRAPKTQTPTTEKELVEKAHGSMRPVSVGHPSIRQ